MELRLKPIYRLGMLIAGFVPATLIQALPTPGAIANAAASLPASVAASRQGTTLPNPTALPAEQYHGPAAVPAYTPQAPLPGAENAKFVLQHLEITGNTIFTYQQLAPLFNQYLNKQVSLADIQKIADQITLKYRNAGYVLSKAVLPAQVIQNGTIKIQIVEGYILDVIVQGDAGAAKPLLEAYGERIKESGPLNISTLERYSLLANDIPGMSVKTVLQQPNNTNAPPGAVDLLLIPSFSKANGFISIDNRGTKYLGPNELSLGGQINSLFQPGDETGVQGLTVSPVNELQYYNAYTKQPLFGTGSMFDLTGSYSKTNPGFLLEPLDVNGLSKELTGDIQIPVIRSRQQSLYITPVLDYLNDRTDIGVFNANFFNDHIRSARLGANYYINDPWQGANQLSLQVSKGLTWFGASSANLPNLSRVDGDPQYYKLNMSFSRLQGITDNLSVFVAGIGQTTPDPLLVAEQFAYGGAVYGVAYDPSEITGDRGMAYKGEIRYNTSPDWMFLNNVQYYTFYDFGKVWNVLPFTLTGLPQEQSGASAGAGMRIGFNSYLSGYVVWADPLTRKVATENSFAPRIFASLTLSGKTPSTGEENPLQNAVNNQPVGYASGQATNAAAAKVAATQVGY